MLSKASKTGTVSFSLKPRHTPKEVCLAGNFTNWQPVAMRRQRDGSYRIDFSLPEGTHEYKFVVDGQWMVDTDHSNWVRNPFGTINSLAIVSFKSGKNERN